MGGGYVTCAHLLGSVSRGPFCFLDRWNPEIPNDVSRHFRHYGGVSLESTLVRGEVQVGRFLGLAGYRAQSALYL